MVMFIPATPGIELRKRYQNVILIKDAKVRIAERSRAGMQLCVCMICGGRCRIILVTIALTSRPQRATSTSYPY